MSGENLFPDYSGRENGSGVGIFLPEKDKSFSTAGSKRCREKQFPAARFTTRRSTPRRGSRKIRLCRYPIPDVSICRAGQNYIGDDTRRCLQKCWQRRQEDAEDLFFSNDEKKYLPDT